MNYLDFTCPICGGTVSCELDQSGSKSISFHSWVSLYFRCDGCGEWIDIDITEEARETKEEAQDYFNHILRKIEGGEMCSKYED